MSPSYAPLLNLVEGFQLRNGDEDNDSLFTTTNVDLTGSRNLKDAKVVFEFRYVVFEVDQSLCYVFFNFIGGGSWGVGGTEDLVANGGHLGKKKVLKDQSQHPILSYSIHLIQMTNSSNIPPAMCLSSIMTLADR